jgi:long-chain acyl-CoA synthetase
MMQARICQRVLKHLIRAELIASNPQLYQKVKLSDITADLPLKDGPLAIDSLTLVGLATAVATMFSLFDSGTEDTLLGSRSPKQWAHIIEMATPEKMVFKTSGSSGEPKCIEHELSILRGEAQFWAALMPQDSKRIVAICPAHHIYGFIWTTLLSAAYLELYGRTLDIIDLALEDLPSSKFESLDIIVTVPTVWDFIAQSKMKLPSNCVGISSTAPLAAQTALYLRALPQMDAFFEIYGSSETSAIGFRVSGNQYRLIPTLAHSANQKGQLVRANSRGEFTRLALQDELAWISDTEFTPIKRKDDVIQLGGNNVSPSWVASKICEAIEVADCAVRSFTHQGKPALKVFIQLASDTEDNRHQVIWDLRQRLPAYAMPRSFAFGSSLPKTENGKSADWPLPA